MRNSQLYPTWRYCYSGQSVIVNNPAEQAALGGGWASSPAAFASYRGPRQPGPHHDPNKWLDEWSLPGLSTAGRQNIRAMLSKAHAAFWRSPDAPDAATRAMILAFDSAAGILFHAGLLTVNSLANDLAALVWDSAIAGGWWLFASEAPNEIFPEKLGQYWIWRDGSRNWNMLFIAEIAEWQARLLEIEAEAATTKPGRAKRLPSTITSVIAARRLEQFLEASNRGQTEFSNRILSTDRTLRRFRATGRVRRDTFDAIAREMGITREALMKP